MDLGKIIQSAVLNSSQIKKETNLDSGQLIKGLGTMVPEILGKLQNNAQDPQSRRSLDEALREHENDDVNDPGRYLDRFNRQEAEKMSGHVFGKDQDEVLNRTKAKTGMDTDQAKKLMLMAVPLVMAYLANHKKENNISEEDLPKETERLNKEHSGGILNSLKGILDKNNDGNIIDDIIGFGK